MTAMRNIKFAFVLSVSAFLCHSVLLGIIFTNTNTLVPCTCISFILSCSISLVWSGWISGFCWMIFDWPESDIRPTQEKEMFSLLKVLF